MVSPWRVSSGLSNLYEFTDFFVPQQNGNPKWAPLIICFAKQNDWGAFRGVSSGPSLGIRAYFSRAPQAMASPQDKNYRRVPLLDHEVHGALAPRSPARMPNIARTIQMAMVIEHVPIGLRICNACGSTKLYACAQSRVACYADGSVGSCQVSERLNSRETFISFDDIISTGYAGLPAGIYSFCKTAGVKDFQFWWWGARFIIVSGKLDFTELETEWVLGFKSVLGWMHSFHNQHSTAFLQIFFQILLSPFQHIFHLRAFLLFSLFLISFTNISKYQDY